MTLLRTLGPRYRFANEEAALTDAKGGLRQRREPPLNASSLKWGNPTNGLARLCAIYAPAVLVQEGL
ncbi:MAG: hypothetical protein V7L25_06210 [Nostoc sp.]|uniref:hypothetical protein n=1 Tax=Nostoc sp. TaxID=1180 RepID=UPI002FEEE5BA